jgi:LemA protein
MMPKAFAGLACLAVVALGAVILIAVLWFVFAYNGLVRLRNTVKEAWAQIDVQLKRRCDLIPNIVETVKGYAAHERETLENVIKARQAGLSATGVKEQAEADNMITGALGKLFALSEAYTNLKANENFLALQEELSSTENKIAFSRQYYNDSVRTFNTRLQTFPTNIVAGLFHFQPAEFFEVTDAAQREAPKVKF